MLAEFLIASICANYGGQYSIACSKASEATFTIWKVQENEKLVTTYFANYADKEGPELIGETPYKTAEVATIVGYSAVKDKQLTYKFKTKDSLPVDYISPTVKQNGWGIGFGWSW